MKFLLDFQESSSIDEINQYLTDIGATVLKNYSFFTNVYLIDVDASPTPNAILQSIISDDELAITLAENYVNPALANYTQTLSVVPESTEDWWKVFSIEGQDLNLSTLNIPKRGKSTHVYLLDSGVLSSHPEFTDSSISQVFSFNGNFSDVVGHGTAMASLISGKTCSLSDAVLKNIKIYHDGTGFHYSDFLNALEAMTTDMSLHPSKAHVVNMSWTMPKNIYIESKLRKINDSYFCLFVAAGGNTNQPIEELTPAGMDICTTVGAYDDDFNPCNFSSITDNPWPLATLAMNAGKYNIWAPGTNIKVAKTDQTYGLASGTSVSAAIQSAAFAYNLSYIVNSEIGHDHELRTFKLHSESKYKILSLNNTPFWESRNIVSCYRTGNYPTTVSETIIDPPVRQDFTVSTTTAFKTYFVPYLPWVVESLAFESLPQGVSIVGGLLIINATEEFLAGQDVKFMNFSIDATLRGGVIQTWEFEIKVVSEQELLRSPTPPGSQGCYPVQACPIGQGCFENISGGGHCSCYGYIDKTGVCGPISLCCYCAGVEQVEC